MQHKQDLPDSENDKLHLLPEETIIQLPDVEDIPGQEYIKPPFFKEYVDTTIASDGEEGVSVFTQEDEESNVSESERNLLQESATHSPGDEEEEDVRIISLDKTDNEGALLNEGNLITDRFGEDMDLPESEEVDEEE